MSNPKNRCRFVGIDLHKESMTICVYEPIAQEVSYRKIACRHREQIVEFFRSLPRPYMAAIETVGFYRWLWELLEPMVGKEYLRLADAMAVRALAGRRLKTDREDAFHVAELLAHGRLPMAYAPPAEVQELRDWTRRRNHLARQHARVLHWVRAVMHLNNRPGPRRLRSTGLIRYLRAHEAELPARHVRQLGDCVEQLALIERQMEAAEREIQRLVGQPRFQRTAQILASFPGVGMVTIATVLAEVGDFSRFGQAKAIARYAGLDPRVFASGGKQRQGHISKTGPSDLRWILQQAAWTAIRVDPAVRGLWQKIARRCGRKAAAVAIARKMLVWMWSAVCRGRPYRPLGQKTS